MVVITGAGRGIGYETARALVWLGANVVLAEVNATTGAAAQNAINREFGEGKTLFVQTDISRSEDVDRLDKAAQEKYGKVDVVLNNATVFPMGAVKDASVESWDLSYSVNLRGPVLLARKFLPLMLQRRHGSFICVSSSGAAPYMGPYEVFKTAQVELANTLTGELEGTGVYAFTIGPGISKTPGFLEGGAKVASYMGMTLDQLFELNKNAQISPEAAGVGFALAVAQAAKYHGQETSSIQVLREANIPCEEAEISFEEKPVLPNLETTPQAALKRGVGELYAAVYATFLEQSEGWKKRNLFERQWVARDFKKHTGYSIDEMQAAFKTVDAAVKSGVKSSESVKVAGKVASYYVHQQEQLRGYEKNPQKLAENLRILSGWVADANALVAALS